MEPMGKVLAQVPDYRWCCATRVRPITDHQTELQMGRGPCAFVRPAEYVQIIGVGACLIMIGMQKPCVRSRMSMEQFGPDRVMFGSNFLSVRCPAFDDLVERHMAIVPGASWTKCSAQRRALFQRLSVLVTCDRAADQ